MKKCCVCNREIIEENNELCRICFEFFKWKYGNHFQKKIEQIKESKKRDRKFSLIKLRRRKWKQRTCVF